MLVRHRVVSTTTSSSMTGLGASACNSHQQREASTTAGKKRVGGGKPPAAPATSGGSKKSVAAAPSKTTATTKTAPVPSIIAPKTTPSATQSTNPFNGAASPMSLASLGSLFKLSQKHELLPRRCGPRHNPILELSNPSPSTNADGTLKSVSAELKQVGQEEKRKLFGGFDFPEIPPRKKADNHTTTQDVKDMFKNMFDPSVIAADEAAMLKHKQEEEEASAASKKGGGGKGKKAKGGADSQEESSMLVDLFAAQSPKDSASVNKKGGGGKAGKVNNKINPDELKEGVDPLKATPEAGLNTTLDEMRTRMAMRKLMGLHFHTYGRQQALDSVERRREKTLSELSQGESLYYRVHTRQEIEEHLRKRQIETNDDSPLPDVIESQRARDERMRAAALAAGKKGPASKTTADGGFMNTMETLAQRRMRKQKELDEPNGPTAAAAADAPKGENIFNYSLDTVTSGDVFNRTNMFPQTENHVVVKTPLMRMLEERQKRKQQNAFMENMKGSSQKGLQAAIAKTGTLGPDPRDQARLAAPSSSMISPLLPDYDEAAENGLLLEGSVAPQERDKFRIASSSATAGFDPVAALRTINDLTGGKNYKGAMDVIVKDGVGSGAVNERFFSKEDFVNRGLVDRVTADSSREIVFKTQQSTKGARLKGAAAAAARAAAETTATATTTPDANAEEEYIDDGVNAGVMEDEWEEDGEATAFTPDMNILGKKKPPTSTTTSTTPQSVTTGGGGSSTDISGDSVEDLERAEEEDEYPDEIIATMKRLRMEVEEELAAAAEQMAASKSRRAAATTTSTASKKVPAAAAKASQKAVTKIATAAGKKKPSAKRK